MLLFGGAGQLGSEIAGRWPAEVIRPSHSVVDICSPGSVSSSIGDVRPDVVVNCAAFHNVDRCESEPERAFAANAIAVAQLAVMTASRGIPLVTISTDYVFDGDADRERTESDVPRPLQVYGTSKYAGELLALANNADALIVRTCGLYGKRPSSTKGYTFVDRIINGARAGEALRIVSDVTASPSYAGHVAGALWKLVDAGARGTYHVVNRGPVTWYAFAVEALRQAGIDHPVTPISSSDWVAPARRPAFSALASHRLAALQIGMPSWEAGIADYLRERSAAG